MTKMPQSRSNNSPPRNQTPDRAGQGGQLQNGGAVKPHENRGPRRLQQNNLSAQNMHHIVKDLRTKLARVLRENDALKEKNEEHEDLHHSYRAAIEDKSVECLHLKNELKGLKSQMGSASQAAGWTIGNFFSGSGGAQGQDGREMRKLQTELAALQAKNRDLEQQIQLQTAQFAQELDEAKRKNLIQVPSISDTEIRGEWKAISCLIQQFILNYLQGPLGTSTPQDNARLNQFSWLPNMAVTLRLPFVRPVILESWIWHFLCFRVFDSRSHIWAGKIGVDFSLPCQQIRDLIARDSGSLSDPSAMIQRFHDWRVRFAHFISQLNAHDKKGAIETTAAAMIRELAVFTPPTLSDNQVHDMQQEALAIVRRASKLDEVFRLSKADFHVFITRVKLPLVSPPSFGFRFDAETMEHAAAFHASHPTNGDVVVDLAVSPGIFKAGNADGENYSYERVLVKLQALCGLESVVQFFSSEDGQAQVKDDEEVPGIKSEPGCVKQELAGTKQTDMGEDDEVMMVGVKSEPCD